MQSVSLTVFILIILVSVVLVTLSVVYSVAKYKESSVDQMLSDIKMILIILLVDVVLIILTLGHILLGFVTV